MKKQPTAPSTTLKSWEEVNLSLRRLSDLTLQKRELENSLTDQINSITQEHNTIATPVLQEIDSLNQDIEAYVLLHKDEFTKDRTKVFSYGSISCRVSKAVRVISKQVCLKALKSLGMDAYINIKEEPNKDMLKTLSDVDLAKVACEFKVTDNITIEPYIEEISAPGAAQ